MTPSRCTRVRSPGQGIVEFALVVTGFLTVIFGIVEFAYAVYAYNTIQHAASEAARRGMVLNRIRTDTNAVGNSFTTAFSGNASGTYTNPACDSATIAGTAGCHRLFLPHTMTVTICAPSSTPYPSSCPASPTSAATIIPAGQYVNVSITYAYSPIIRFPLAFSFNMRAQSQTQTQ